MELDRDETLHVTASRWWQRRESELAENTKLDYRWRVDHVLLDLAHTATAAMDARRVNDFRQQLHARGLSPRSATWRSTCSPRSRRRRPVLLPAGRAA